MRNSAVAIYNELPTTRGRLDRDLTEDVTVTVRPFDSEDTKFVLHSWLRSMRGQFRDAVDYDYYPGVQDEIRRISTVAKVIVACDAEKPWFILGYCVADPVETTSGPMVVYYCFTKVAYRRRGIARALMESHGWQPGKLVITPYWTYYCKDIKHVVRLRYNPWLIAKLPP